MAVPTAGYDGEKKDTAKEYNPSDQEWRIERAAVPADDSVIVRVTLDGEPVGMLQLPSLMHLRYLREKLQT